MINLYSKFLLRYINKNFLKEFINILLYPLDIRVVSDNSDILINFKKFIKMLMDDVNSDNLKIQISKTQILNILRLINNILILKEDINFSFITYDNILEYFNNIDSNNLSILSETINKKIENNADYQKSIDTIISEIYIYKQMQVIKSTLTKWDNIDFESKQPTLNLIKEFKDVVLETNIKLSELSVYKPISDSSSLIFDKNDYNGALINILQFLKNSYNSYKSGYSLIDNNINGIESSSVTIISGPSNHAKSIFMLNIAKKMMQLNDSNSDEVFLFVTLEDDVYKLFRRIISIFGNYDTEVIKTLFNESSSCLRNIDYIDIVTKNINDIFDNLVRDSVFSIINDRKFIIKHNSEKTISVSDINYIIDSLIVKGLKVKCLFVDYINVMIPSNYTSNNKTDDYQSHGLIVQEMRQCSRKYGIPIITITQSNRAAENNEMELNNNMIGDSLNKIRYADNVIMIRQRTDIDIFNNKVAEDIQLTDNSIDDITNVLKYIVPFEVKITKAKDGAKPNTQFHVLNTKNLRITDTIMELYNDYSECVDKSELLLNKINTLQIPIQTQEINTTDYQLIQL